MRFCSDGAFYTGSSDTGWYYNPNPSESSRHRIVWQGCQADLNYAGETGMLIAGGNSLGRGVLARGVKSGNSRQNSGNVVRYAREYPKIEAGPRQKIHFPE